MWLCRRDVAQFPGADRVREDTARSVWLVGMNPGSRPAGGCHSLVELSGLGNAVGDAFLVVDSEQRVVVFNEAAERMFGHHAGEILGEPLENLLPDQFRSRHAEQASGFRFHGVGHRLPASGRSRVSGLRADGDVFPAEITLSVLNVGGEVMASAVVRDVTARVETEQALSESEERFRVAFELSPVAMAILDLEGRCVSANIALAEQTGYALDRLVGMAMVELAEPDDLSSLVESVNRILSGESPTARAEVRQRRADGTTGVIDMNLAIVVDQEGEPQYVIGQSLDITDRVKGQAELEAMLRSKDELIASVSHELRTPLTTLVGFARLLHDDSTPLSEGERAEMMEAIVHQSADLTNIVDDLLVAAKAKADALEVVRVSVDLRAQVAQVLETWTREEVDHVQILGSRTSGVGDPARVRQILRNLVSNALRYGGQEIVIWIEENETWARVGVGDNGDPISDEDRERIFEPYQRAHQTVGVTPSLGFGLAVSRQLAHLMGGALTYHREKDHNVFWLTLNRRKGTP